MQYPVVIAGDPIIIWSAVIAAIGCFGLFVLKVSDKWSKFRKKRRQNPQPRQSLDQLLS